ncbi:MAG TPA: carboxypeptidase-like regulatory domain-containing protein, partial [Longimicrobium sp.]|nr:carboxypeptidase-like regulatory domain-containing protein [Longimicrobium sp.]
MRPSRLRLWSGALLLLLGGVLPARLSAQDPYVITGTVLDAESRQPIAGATVQVRTGATTGGTQTVTDAAGRYRLAARVPAGSYTVQFTRLGRASASRQVTLGAAREVQLEPVLLGTAVLQMEEVVVTGTGAPVARREVGNTVASVSGEAVNNAPAASSVD